MFRLTLTATATLLTALCLLQNGYFASEVRIRKGNGLQQSLHPQGHGIESLDSTNENGAQRSQDLKDLDAISENAQAGGLYFRFAEAGATDRSTAKLRSEAQVLSSASVENGAGSKSLSEASGYFDYSRFANRCCQVCPEQFFAQLQLLERDEKIKRLAYGMFYKWHASRYNRGRSQREAYRGENLNAGTDRPSFLQVGVEARAGGFASYVPIGGPIPPREVMQQAPCCPICPSWFLQKLNRPKSGSFMPNAMVLSEISESMEESGMPSLQPYSKKSRGGHDPAANTKSRDWRKKGGVTRDSVPPLASSEVDIANNYPSAKVESTERDDYQRHDVASSLKKEIVSFLEVQMTPTARAFHDWGPRSFTGQYRPTMKQGKVVCCNVCISQFYPPREFDDVSNPEFIVEPTLPKFRAKNGWCCQMCAQNLDPDRWMTTRHRIDGDVDLRKAGTKAWRMGTKYDTYTLPPVNPRNSRTYKRGGSLLPAGMV